MSLAVFECPKCGRAGMRWCGRAKILTCHYLNCRHVVRIPGQVQIPSAAVIRAAISKEKLNEA